MLYEVITRLNLGFDIKPVSLFSDVLKDEEPQVPIEVKKIVEQQKKEDAYPSGMVGFENFSGEDEPRITSYNVCYTKLLRTRSKVLI